MTSPILRLHSFGIALGGRVILADVNLELPPTGMTVLVGPAGCGKSTLLRTLAGLNDSHPSLSTWGEMMLGGRAIPTSGSRHAIPTGERPCLVMQHARFFLDSVRENLVSALPNRAELDRASQTNLVLAKLRSYGLEDLVQHLDEDAVTLPLGRQRALAVARSLVTDPPLVLADEPTAALEESDAMRIIATLRAQAAIRAVVFVTHNQHLARAAGGTTVLLAGGSIQEVAPTSEFFVEPRTPLATQFVRSGGCSAVDPDVPAECLEPGVTATPLPEAAVVARRRSTRSPRGFFWVIDGRLGGLPRPGIIESLEVDLAGLQQLGVSVLVTLEESSTVAAAELRRFRMDGMHFPVVDMGVPTTTSAAALCDQVDRWMAAGRAVALHCRAGLGRTGTLLACQLIWSGATARAALESVRAINPRCVQSDAQALFLHSFEASLEGQRSATRGRMRSEADR